jgi:hypothetical protein
MGLKLSLYPHRHFIELQQITAEVQFELENLKLFNPTAQEYDRD